MPARGFKKRDPSTERLKVGLTTALNEQLAERAGAAVLTASDYVRGLIEHDVGERADKPRPRKDHGTMLLLAEVHTLAIQIKKLGTNVNQMAHQVNAGMVPLTRPEVAVMTRQVAVAMELAQGLFEKVLNR